jgi:glycosyltransferase involved in cell wall biosynthesis
MPFITIIIPAYNRSSTIYKAIESVLNQTFNDFELIIVNDGSTDDTIEFIKRNFTDSRVKIYTQSNLGVSAARNNGIERATGEYITFLDSDDFVEQNWLSDFVELIKLGYKVISCGFKTYNGFDYKINKPTQQSALLHYYTASFLAGSFIINKEILTEIGYYDKYLTYSENLELGMRITSFCLLNKLEIGIINTPNLIIIQEGDRIKRYSNKKLYSNIRLLKKYKELFDKSSKDHLVYLSISGVEAMRLGKNKTARIFFYRFYNLKRFDKKNLLRILVTFNPKLMKLIYN